MADLAHRIHSVRGKPITAARKALLRRPIDLENEVHAPLKAYGFKLPAQIYHARFDDMARRAVIADPLLAEALGPLLDTRSHLYRVFLGIGRRVRSVAHDDPICQLLMSAPGIGFVAADLQGRSG
jgi:transposase